MWLGPKCCGPNGEVCGLGTGVGGGTKAVTNEKTGREGLPSFMEPIWDPAEVLEQFLLSWGGLPSLPCQPLLAVPSPSPSWFRGSAAPGPPLPYSLASQPRTQALLGTESPLTCPRNTVLASFLVCSYWLLDVPGNVASHSQEISTRLRAPKRLQRP